MKKTFYLASIAILGLSVIPAHAAGVTEDFQTWGNITAVGNFGALNQDWKDFKYWLEGQGRFGNDSSRFSQSLMRLGAGYAINSKTSIWTGFAWAPTSKPFTQNPFNEYRIWQQLLWNDTFSDAATMLRFRLEERFFDISQSDDVAFRFRQLAKLTLPIPFAPPAFRFAFTNEVFVHLNNTDQGLRRGFDQNRAFAGVAYRFNPETTMEVGYMNHYIKKYKQADQMQHILSINLYFNF
ncbi:MAG: DUF2490 domain-containing protein [Nitrosomonas halophila]|jgi:hypothetical protein